MSSSAPATDVDATIKSESAAPSADIIRTLPVRAYLDQTVVPLLMQGMSELVKVRPTDPVQWLAKYLQDNNPQRKK